MHKPMAEAVFVKTIIQTSQTTFTIEWTDGQKIDYRLSDLQKKCPCAQCRDEKTGELLINPRKLNENVEAFRVKSVGRYALRIDFTSGCSKGIFTFSFLRSSLH